MSCYATASFSSTFTHTSGYATASFSCTFTHTSCYATASFSCNSTNTSCYATASFSCTSTHTSCDTIARFLLRQYSCHTKFRKQGLSLKNAILWGKALKMQYFRWTLRGFKLIENTMIWWKCWKTLTKLKLNTYDGMSILHHCTASYQRRYLFFFASWFHGTHHFAQ